MTDPDRPVVRPDDLPEDLAAALPEALGPVEEAALAEASSWVGSRGVEGVALGRTDTGGDCVVVYTSGGPADLPAQVGGLPVRVETTNPFQALHQDTRAPARPQPGMPPPGAGS